MRLKFDARARAILRRLPRVNIYSATELALLALLAIQSARLMWAIVTPIAPLGAWTPTGPTLPSDPGSVFATFDPFYRVSGAQASGPAAVTSLQLTLFGTRIDGAQGGGSAIVAGPDGEQKSIAVGEEVAPGVVLKAVAFDHITLDRGGATEDLFLAQSGATTGGTTPDPGAPMNRTTPGAPPPGAASPGPPPPGAGVPPVAAPATTTAVRPEVSAIPRIEGGRINGLTLRGTGAYRAAGLQDGDVLMQVNGQPVGGAGDIERLGNGPATVTIERNGKTQTVSIPGTKQ